MPVVDRRRSAPATGTAPMLGHAGLETAHGLGLWLAKPPIWTWSSPYRGLRADMPSVQAPSLPSLYYFFETLLLPTSPYKVHLHLVSEHVWPWRRARQRWRPLNTTKAEWSKNMSLLAMCIFLARHGPRKQCERKETEKEKESKGKGKAMPTVCIR